MPRSASTPTGRAEQLSLLSYAAVCQSDFGQLLYGLSTRVMSYQNASTEDLAAGLLVCA